MFILPIFGTVSHVALLPKRTAPHPSKKATTLDPHFIEQTCQVILYVNILFKGALRGPKR